MLLALLTLAACGGGGGGGGNNVQGDIRRPDANALKPVSTSGAYNEILVSCVTAETAANSCLLSDLPLLGSENLSQGSGSVTVENIIARTAVSHDWMALRFREALERMPSDLLQLFRGVTGVVISYNIRPSYYTSATGAIYLDPAHLWLTNEEKATIETNPDFRSGFGSELQFVPLWRYVKGNDYAWRFFPLDGDKERTIDDIVMPLAALLFHELAHANDFFPPTLLGTMDSSQSVLEASNAIASQRGSSVLLGQDPLRSEMWKGLGGVLYRGDTATEAQRELTAETVGMEFSTDGASDNYAYSSVFEDLAMLFEEVMMKHHFDVDREVAHTLRPTSEEPTCSEYVVKWGVRNRVGDSMVSPRAEIALQRLLGRNDVSEYLSNFPSPVAMQKDMDWCRNLATFGQNGNNKTSGEQRKLSGFEQGGSMIRPTDVGVPHNR